MIRVDERAIRQLIDEALGGDEMAAKAGTYAPKGPVNVSPVVAKDAAVSDPEDESFVPHDKQELNVALHGLVDDVSNDDVPDLYKTIKTSVDRVTGDNRTMKTSKNENQKKKIAESLIRKHVRSIIAEVTGGDDEPAWPTEPKLKYDMIYKRLFDLVDDGDTDGVVAFFDEAAESDEFRNMFADALTMITRTSKGGSKPRADGECKDAADKLRDSDNISIANDNIVRYMRRVGKIFGGLAGETPPDLAKEPLRTIAGGWDVQDAEVTPMDMKTAKEREKLEKAELDKLHGMIAAQTGYGSVSTIVNMIRSGKDKLVLSMMFNYLNFGVGYSLHDIGDAKMLTDKDNVLELAWPAMLVAATLCEKNPPDNLESADVDLWWTLKDGYDVYQAAIVQYVNEMNEAAKGLPKGERQITYEDGLRIAQETDPFSGNKNMPEHKAFVEVFDRVASALDRSEKGRYGSWRNFLMYWGQDLDKFFDKALEAYQAATMVKYKQGVEQRRADRTAAPPKTTRR